MKTLTKRRRNIVELKTRARRVLTASINLVQERWGKLDRRKRSNRSIHIYEIRSRADKHVLTVHKVPATGFTAPTSTIVNIQPGAEHLYTAVWDSGLIYLHPGGVWLTPGAHWQNHGDGTP